jgi:hypothetical protein
VNPDWPCPAQPQKRDAYTSSSFSLSLCYDKSVKSKGKFRTLMKKAVLRNMQFLFISSPFSRKKALIRSV